ncbi:MAG: hypothetical protein IKR13_04145 [Victivallales bacterium]|nr:hypothetical protein [Victivallales bacterium]
MSGLAWIILNLALAIGAVYGTVKVRSTPVPKPLQLEEAAKPEADSQHKALSRNEKADETEPAKPRALAANAPMDDLWKQTLFLPTRTEDTGEEDANQAAAEQAEQAARNIEFELVGLAQINVLTEEDPVPVAILRSKVGSERGGRPSPRRGGPPNRNNPRGPQPAATPDSPTKNDEKQVFRVGEKINQTGYLLKNIDLDEKFVEVTRNGETVKLSINFVGTEAVQRREAVTKATTQKHQEQQRRIEQENRERQQTAAAVAQQNQTNETQTTNQTGDQPQPNANPGAPPPPPGTSAQENAAGGTQNGSASPDARAERLRRIAEARQQRQARQQQGSNAQNNSSEAAPPPPPPGQ